MRMPEMRYADRIKKAVQEKFGGYEHTRGAGDGALWDMENLSSRFFPLLGTRAGRKTVQTLTKPNGLYAAEQLAWVDGTAFYYGGEARGTVTDGHKRFGTLGTMVVILPDKCYYDTREAAAKGTATAAKEPPAVKQEGDLWLWSEDGKAPWKLMRYQGIKWYEQKEGYAYGDVLRYGTAAPWGLAYWDGAKWQDMGHKSFGGLEARYTASGTAVVRLQDGWVDGEPAAENTLYCASVDFRNYFREGDAVTLSGLTGEENNKRPIIREISEDGHALRFYEYTFEFTADNYQTETGSEKSEASLRADKYMAQSYQTLDGGDRFFCNQNVKIANSSDGAVAAVGKYFITLADEAQSEATGRIMYHVTAAQFNGSYVELTMERMVRQGYQAQETGVTIRRTVPDMDFVCSNENRLWGCRGDHIYASKPGDAFNWNVFDGLASDSWAVDAGTPGRFTGCVSYLGYPMFFKEQGVYKVYGSMPSNFELMASVTMGVMDGAGESLAVAGDALFYLSGTGVCAYTGGAAASLAAPFGEARYCAGVGGSTGLKYYISMQDETQAWHLFCYDTQNRTWHREDGSQAVGMARTADGLHLLTSGGALLRLDAADSTETVEWMAEFGDMTDGDPNRKGVGRFQIRLELGAGAELWVELKDETRQSWQTLLHTRGRRKKQSMVLPVIPRRTDHYRLRLRGKGECVVYSIAREYYAGSDWR